MARITNLARCLSRNQLRITPGKAKALGFPIRDVENFLQLVHNEEFSTWIHCKDLPVPLQLLWLDKIKLNKKQAKALEEVYCTWLTKVISFKRSAAPALGLKLLNLLHIRLDKGIIQAYQLADLTRSLPKYDQVLVFSNIAKACYYTNSYYHSYSFLQDEDSTELSLALNKYFEKFF